MAQKQLQAVVVIGGQVDNSFRQIGDRLIQMGGLVDGVSQKLIDFGKESVQTYADYEYSMKQIQGVWETNGTFEKGSKRSKDAMDALGESIQVWAANSKFHVNDVTNAVLDATHAGWDLDKVLGGMPVVMELAKAGDLDLSTATDYLVSSMASLGMEYQDLGTFVDMWVYGANNSKGTVADLGEMFERMGSTMRLAADPAEIITLAAAMHDMGTEGAEAGTLIRNGMLRLLAPSGSAKKYLVGLGYSIEEVNELMEDVEPVSAWAALDSYGFSAFDEKGEAKPMIQVYRELGECLADIAGGWDKIDKNETTISILKDMFGQKSMTGAMNFLNSIQKMSGMYDELQSGAAEGAAGYMSDLMTDTLTERIEHFSSQMEELRRSVGEALAPEVETWLGRLGDFVDGVTNLDDGKFNALVGALKGLAIAGPGMLAAGGALKMIGMLLTPTGALALGVTTLTALASAVKSFQEVDFQEQFGDLHLDDSVLGDYVEKLGTSFDTAYANVNSFAAALDTAVTNYNTAAQTFQGNLLSDVLTEKTWTSEDLKSYETLGADIVASALTGVKNSTAMAQEFWRVLLGGDSSGSLPDDPAYASVVSVLTDGLTQTEGQLETLGAGLKNAITKAFEEGLTDENVAAIQYYFNELNRVMAEAEAQAQSDREAAELQLAFRKAQGMSYKDMQKYLSETILPSRDSRLQQLEDDYYTNLYMANIGYDRQLENASSWEEYDSIKAEKETFNANAEQAYQNQRNALYADYDTGIASLYRELTRGSTLSDANDFLTRVTTGVEQGLFSGKEAMDYLMSSGYNDHGFLQQSDNAQLFELYNGMVESLGGQEEMQSRIQSYLESGNNGAADQLQRILTNRDVLAEIAASRYVAPQYPEAYDHLYTSDHGGKFSIDGEINALQGELDDLNSRIHSEFRSSGTNVTGNVSYTLDESGSEELQELYDQRDALQARIRQLQADKTSAVDNWLYGTTTPTEQPIVPRFAREGEQGGTGGESAGVIASLNSSISGFFSRLGTSQASTGVTASVTNPDGVTVQVEGDTTMLQASIDSQNYQQLLAYVDGDTAPISAKIEAQNGRVLYERVDGDVSALRSKLDSLQNTPVTVTIRTNTVNVPSTSMNGYATGGRADEPSIFGEAGPEWAIPERHDANTARLLMSAANASGFRLAELPTEAYAYGGGGGGGDSTESVQVVYAPTIYAQDADGVDHVLKADKQRLDKLLEDRDIYESVVSYR